MVLFPSLNTFKIIDGMYGSSRKYSTGVNSALKLKITAPESGNLLSVCQSTRKVHRSIVKSACWTSLCFSCGSPGGMNSG